jgi:hypothetical protein
MAVRQRTPISSSGMPFENFDQSMGTTAGEGNPIGSMFCAHPGEYTNPSKIKKMSPIPLPAPSHEAGSQERKAGAAGGRCLTLMAQVISWHSSSGCGWQKKEARMEAKKVWLDWLKSN